MKNVFTTKQKLVRLAYTTGLLSLVLAVALSLSAGGTLAANLFATAPGLGVADSFAVLGGSTVTNTGTSNVYGNLGVWPSLAVTGFPPGIVHLPGVIHAGDAVAQNAQNDVTTANTALGLAPCDFDLTGQDLGGKTLQPGVYCFDTSAQLTGTLTLDAKWNEYSVFIFKMGSTLTTASNSSVRIINGDKLCNIFWQAGSSATLGTTTAFWGNILADQSITLNTGATLNGRALAQNAAVTLDTNRIIIPVCEAQPAFSLRLVKAATPLTYINVGDVINYTYTLTNTGSEMLYAPYSVTDDLLTVTCPDSPANLATGESVVCTASTTIDQDDLDAGSITNTATATAIGDDQQPVLSNEDSETVTVVHAQPTPTAGPTEETSADTPETLLPDTGGDLAGPGSQIIRTSLGALGLTLILFAFMVSRRTQKAER